MFNACLQKYMHDERVQEAFERMNENNSRRLQEAHPTIKVDMA